MRGYDAWLEEPFQREQAEGERFAEEYEKFCELNGYDVADESHVPEFQRWIDDREAEAKISQYEDWLEFSREEY